MGSSKALRTMLAGSRVATLHTSRRQVLDPTSQEHPLRRVRTPPQVLDLLSAVVTKGWPRWTSCVKFWTCRAQL